MNPERRAPVTQEEFVKSHKRHHHMTALLRISVLMLFLFYWEIGAKLSWFDTFFFSSPSGVVNCGLELLRQNNLLMHVGITLLETVISFVLVTVFSLLVATILWYLPRTAEITEPYLVILNSLPKSALAPLFIVWFGTNMRTIVIAGISVAVFGSIITFYTAFRQADPEKCILITTLGGKKIDIFTKVILPGSAPILLSTSKVNIGLALVGVIIGEFLSARRGLGYLIIYGSQVFRLDMVITGILILCIIALCFYQSLQTLEHMLKKKT